MLAIKTTSSTKTLTPNLLPCSIKHNGPVTASKRYWSPSTNDPEDGTSIAHFRGRKLRGRKVKLPERYQGVVLQKTENLLPQKAHPESAEMEVDDGDEDEMEEVKLMETQGKFDEVVVWGHEVLPEEDDEYVKGVREWIAFAEAMHTERPTDNHAST